MPEFYGIKIDKVKELINPELPEVKVGGGGTDMVLLTDEDKYLHIGFETGKESDDITKHLSYDTRLMQRDRREVVTVIVYTADVTQAPSSINGETLVYNPHIVLMADYDGSAIYADLNAKIEKGQPLDDKDILNLLFLPLMKNTIPRAELATKSVEMAKAISDQTKQETCIAAAFAFAYKYLDENETNNLLEAIKMMDGINKLSEMIAEEVEKRTASTVKTDVAKEMLQAGETFIRIMQYTKLDKETLEELQLELEGVTA